MSSRPSWPNWQGSNVLRRQNGLRMKNLNVQNPVLLLLNERRLPTSDDSLHVIFVSLARSNCSQCQ